jgi:nickel-dependent lactate racemase
MDLSLPWGKTHLEASVPEGNLLAVVEPGEVREQEEESEVIQRALALGPLAQGQRAAPLGTSPLHEMVRPGQRTVIVVSDITRPCPTHKLLPPLLAELSAGGVRDEDIRIIFALGTHRRHAPHEQKRLVGEEVFRRIRCQDFDPHDTVYLGRTSRGTPVVPSRAVAEAEFKICLGNIEFHYFAGYTGGAKAILPGVCAPPSIHHNHSLMVLPEATSGWAEGNPVREDIEEAGRLVGVDFILNVVLDRAFRIVEAVAGDPYLAHRQGCRYVDGLYKVPIPAPGDIVLVSTGGYPKDINLYQAHKALEHAVHAVREGGVIILLAQCPEGWGHDVFEEWLLSGDPPEVLIERIGKRFVLGGHKAAAIARIRKRAALYLVSSLPPEACRAAGFQPFTTTDEALAAAFARSGPKAQVIVIPHGNTTLPLVGEEGG